MQGTGPTSDIERGAGEGPALPAAANAQSDRAEESQRPKSCTEYLETQRRAPRICWTRVDGVDAEREREQRRLRLSRGTGVCEEPIRRPNVLRLTSSRCRRCRIPLLWLDLPLLHLVPFTTVQGYRVQQCRRQPRTLIRAFSGGLDRTWMSVALVCSLSLSLASTPPSLYVLSIHPSLPIASVTGFDVTKLSKYICICNMVYRNSGHVSRRQDIAKEDGAM